MGFFHRNPYLLTWRIWGIVKTPSILLAAPSLLISINMDVHAAAPSLLISLKMDVHAAAPSLLISLKMASPSDVSQ